ncbi:CBS domain-containing protein [Gelidibacter maritimus]|uniref:CBS domain-containing protein n=1 Tax=Gelidibacter maritimus TaxID=2761487 RepID=A0A7W2M646_9FLAO|nr:CBS domain-containing protein [Gelidibacter maritimus]MBA6153378.1 CBS domain-containing protein [Gelidibacter maritimus]
MKNIQLVSAIMTTKIVKLKKDDDLERAEYLFKKHKIRHIPVVDGKSIIGMLSYTDLLRISFVDAVDDDGEIESLVYNMFTIEQVMAKNVVSVSSTASIKEVAEILTKREFHALPVVDDNELVGIVTTTDLIEFLIMRL